MTCVIKAIIGIQILKLVSVYALLAISVTLSKLLVCDIALDVV